ncbi:MAG TPA: hypothetical protein VGN88_02555 [Phycisphaerae bacterium]|jgi:hypothetical protein
MQSKNNRIESYDSWRSRTLAETSRFIEWGLQNPDKVPWIPKHPVGQGGFSEKLKTIFWSLVAQKQDWPD